jgi:hypothetical protein
MHRIASQHLLIVVHVVIRNFLMANLKEHSIFIKFCFRLATHDFLMADLMEQSVFIKLCFKHGKIASKTPKMLRIAFDDNGHSIFCTNVTCFHPNISYDHKTVEYVGTNKFLGLTN